METLGGLCSPWPRPRPQPGWCSSPVIPRSWIVGRAMGLFINTAGVGEVVAPRTVVPTSVQPGDVILISGDIGRHGMTIMATKDWNLKPRSTATGCWPKLYWHCSRQALMFIACAISPAEVLPRHWLKLPTRHSGESTFEKTISRLTRRCKPPARFWVLIRCTSQTKADSWRLSGLSMLSRRWSCCNRIGGCIKRDHWRGARRIAAALSRSPAVSVQLESST